WFSLTAASAVLAWVRRGDFDAFYISSETAGMLLSWLLKFSRRRPKIAILNHYLSQKKKSRLFRWLGSASTPDGVICVNEFQTTFAKTVLRVPPTKVFKVKYGAMVDGSFFTSALANQSQHAHEESSSLSRTGTLESGWAC